MDANTLISLMSAVAALLAALYAASAARSSKRSADVAERQYADTRAGINVDLIDAYSWVGDDGCHIIAIGTVLSNRASMQTSIVRSELRIHEYVFEGVTNSIILRPKIVTLLPGDMLKRLSEPLNLQAGGTESGWLTFHLPSHFTAQRTVDKYEIQFITATGVRAGVSTHIMRKVEYESNKD